MKMSLHRVVIAAISLAFVGAGMPTSLALAHDCGTQCTQCGSNLYEGYSHSDTGTLNMSCVGRDQCKQCVVQSVNELQDLGAELLSRMALGADQELGELVGLHKEVLLLDVSRNLLAIRASPCDPNTITATVFLTEGRAKALGELAVPSLRVFLAS